MPYAHIVKIEKIENGWHRKLYEKSLELLRHKKSIENEKREELYKLAEDIEKAILYLNEETPNTLIAYSRGGAILLQALAMGAKKPDTVYLVAPAWNRQWPTVSLTGSEISGNGAIIHGGSDNIVPLKHSVMLAKESGMPLYVFPGLNHVNILKNKDNPTSGIQLKDFKTALDVLPDWGKTGKATDEELKIQEEFVNTI